MTCPNTASSTDKLIIIDGSTSAVKCHMPVEQFLEQVVIKDATETVKGIVELNTGVDTPACYTDNVGALTAVGMTRMLSANPESPQMAALKLLIDKQTNPCETNTRAMDAIAAVGGLVGDWAQVAAAYNTAGGSLQPGALVLADGQVYKLIGANWRVDPRTDKGMNWQVVAGTPGFIASALALGAPLGDWATVKNYFKALGLPIPVGARVIGSDGKVYQVSSGSDGMTDPTATGATGYVDVSAGVDSGVPAVFSSDSKPDPAIVKVGDTWNTTALTSAPYSKLSTYRWDGAAWQWLYGEGFVVFDWNSPEYTTPGAYHLFKFSSAAKPHGDTLNGTASADKYVIPEKGTYVITANYMGRDEWTGRIPGDIVGSRMRLVINSAQRGWNGNLMYGQVADAGVWSGHSVSEVIKVEAGSEVVCEIEQSYSKLLAAMWRVNIKRVG